MESWRGVWSPNASNHLSEGSSPFSRSLSPCQSTGLVFGNARISIGGLPWWAHVFEETLFLLLLITDFFIIRSNYTRNIRIACIFTCFPGTSTTSRLGWALLGQWSGWLCLWAMPEHPLRMSEMSVFKVKRKGWAECVAVTKTLGPLLHLDTQPLPAPQYIQFAFMFNRLISDLLKFSNQPAPNRLGGMLLCCEWQSLNKEWGGFILELIFLK